MKRLCTISILSLFFILELSAQNSPETPSKWIQESSIDELSLPTNLSSIKKTPSLRENAM
jgi:hypothetical protein